MIRRKRQSGLGVYQSALHRSGDVAIGAYARLQRRRRIQLAALGLALIGAAAAFYFLLQPSDEVTPSNVHPVSVRCVTTDCGYAGVVQVRTGQEAFPLKCPQCGQRSCYQLWHCRDCGQQFLIRKGAGELICPQCWSRRVGAAEGPASGDDGS